LASRRYNFATHPRGNDQPLWCVGRRELAGESIPRWRSYIKTAAVGKQPAGPALTVALVTWGLSLALLVGAEGSLAWRLARMGVVVAITAATLRNLHGEGQR
jgi:hypothetical protein